VLATPDMINKPPNIIEEVNFSSRRTIPAIIEVIGSNIKKGDTLLTSTLLNK
jgi:hypothetical protein